MLHVDHSSLSDKNVRNFGTFIQRYRVSSAQYFSDSKLASLALGRSINRYNSAFYHIENMDNITVTLSRMFKLVVGERVGAIIDSTSEATRLLLTGPSSSGKTSLLFEYAMSCAEQGESVLYIAPKHISSLPLFVNGRTQPKSSVLQLINFVYLSSHAELVNFFSKVHLNRSRSSWGQAKHVVIDEFDSYFLEKASRTEEITRIAKCLACTVDAIEYISKMQQSGGTAKTKCHLLIAETISSDSYAIEKQGLYRHWIRDFLRISKTGDHLFEIQHKSCKGGTNVPSEIAIHYQITDKAILLQDNE